jgi:hypothetical protein
MLFGTEYYPHSEVARDMMDLTIARIPYLPCLFVLL